MRFLMRSPRWLTPISLTGRQFVSYGLIVKRYFVPLSLTLTAWLCSVNTLAEICHERRAKRAIRIIKKLVLILRCTQVYKLPVRLNEAAVMDVVTTLTMTPNKRSGNQSLRKVVTGKKINAPKDIRIKFGKLCKLKSQVNHIVITQKTPALTTG